MGSRIGEFFGPIIGGEKLRTDEAEAIRNPYTGEVIAECYQASSAQAQDAIARAAKAFETTRRMPRYQRAEILNRLADIIDSEKEDLATLISLEAGKPMVDARGEVARSVLNCRGAAEEAKRTIGEEVPLDMDGDVARYQNMVSTHSSAGDEGPTQRLGIAKAYPIGPILAVAPFNFPMNLALHKVAPAIASGNPVVLKPSPQAPLTGVRLGEMLLEAGMPADAISVVPASNAVAEEMVLNDAVAMVTFTGSAQVGWHIKSLVPKKKVTLELGGNGGVFIDETTRNLEYAARRCARGANVYAGQYCIGVQRILVHEARYEEFLSLIDKELQGLRVGDPIRDDVDLGPVIDDGSATRIDGWIREAVEQGAKLLAGGEVDRAVVLPTLLADTAPTMRVEREEIFGPVATINSVSNWDEGIAKLNDSDFGLQTGVFTGRIDRALEAFGEVNTGGLIINDVPIYRIDNMPFGGVKDSGFGKEGTRYAIESMMETKFIMLAG